MGDMILKAAEITPSDRQLSLQRIEFYSFIHFSIATFSDREWGLGNERPSMFNPGRFDPDQWVSVVKSAGMKGLILTAKHHDGFCLWPSRYTDYSVKNSSWRNGRGDVVRDVQKACERGGLKFGIYLSPWDRHESSYGDSSIYNRYFENQLQELLSDYGDIFCVWLDGAKADDGKDQIYNWDDYYRIIRKLQPGATIHICGPDVRWVGNEAGFCRESEWSVQPSEVFDCDMIAGRSQQQEGASPDTDIRNDKLGNRAYIENAENLIWYPAEVDVSIRPGWFYHSDENGRVLSPDELLDIYLDSVGGNALLLLNIPPDNHGLIHAADVWVLTRFGGMLQKIFSENLAAAAEVRSENGSLPGTSPDFIVDGRDNIRWLASVRDETVTFELRFDGKLVFNILLLQEDITLGQRIERFTAEFYTENGKWESFTGAGAVGYKRILRFAAVKTEKIRIRITEYRAAPAVLNLGLYSYVFNQGVNLENR